MLITVKNLFRHLPAMLAACLIQHSASAQTAAPQSTQVTTQDKQVIEEIVKQYLLKNPGVIRDAMVALQQQEEAEQQKQSAAALQAMKGELDADKASPVGGNAKGDVTVVEFYDYNCGFCKKAAPDLAELLKRDPNVRVVYKEYPILSEQSLYASRAALAARRQGKFNEFHVAMMASPAANEATVKSVSQKLKLDYNKLLKDMKDPALEDELRKNQRQGTALNINGTPAFIVGDRLIPGAADANQLIGLVQAERQKQQK